MEDHTSQESDEKREQAKEITDLVHLKKEGSSDLSDKSSDESNERGRENCDQSFHVLVGRGFFDDSSEEEEDYESSSSSSSSDDDDQSSLICEILGSEFFDKSSGYDTDEYSSSEEEDYESSSDDSDSDDYADEYDASAGSFDQVYNCYPLSQIEKSLPDNGDKIIMPTSAITHLLRLNVGYPMQFEIKNQSTGRVSHCGVLEFTGNEDCVYLPTWMMENMKLQEGDPVIMKNVKLDKGTYMKLQPHTTDFIHLPCMKDMLEDILRNFSCLTIGDTIMINHNNCEAEFAPPLDYKEPQKPATKNALANDQGEQANKERKFIPFTGLARRLDGTNSTEPAVPELSSEEKEQPMGAADTRMATQPKFSSHNRAGKIVFGSHETQPMKISNDFVQAETSKKDQQKFQPFTGKKYKLTD
nr:ubiquitin fusion degradation protein 1 like [Quercus suber]